MQIWIVVIRLSSLIKQEQWEGHTHTHTWNLNYSLFLKDDFVFSDQTMLKTRSIQWGYNPGITGRHGGEITIVLTIFSYIGLWYAPLWSSPVQQGSENRWRERGGDIGEENSLQVYYICQAFAYRKRTSIWTCQHSFHIIVSCWFVLWILVEGRHWKVDPKAEGIVGQMVILPIGVWAQCIWYQGLFKAIFI